MIDDLVNLESLVYVMIQNGRLGGVLSFLKSHCSGASLTVAFAAEDFLPLTAPVVTGGSLFDARTVARYLCSAPQVLHFTRFTTPSTLNNIT